MIIVLAGGNLLEFKASALVLHIQGGSLGRRPGAAETMIKALYQGLAGVADGPTTGR